MKNKIKKILKQELTRAYLGLFVCLVFTAVGIGLIVAGIHGGAFDNISSTIITGIFVLIFFWNFYNPVHSLLKKTCALLSKRESLKIRD